MKPTPLVQSGRPNAKLADALKDELTRREAALATAHADNQRLQTAVRQQLASKRALNAELQVLSLAGIASMKTMPDQTGSEQFTPSFAVMLELVWAPTCAFGSIEASHPSKN